MSRKIIILVLILSLGVCMFSGCDAATKFTDDVSQTAKAELEKLVKSTLEKNKIDVVEVKTAVGKLNDTGKLQFFCAALVKANSDSIPQTCADALGKIFEDAGLKVQTAPAVDSPYLVHKTVTFKHTDYTDGTYYMVYAYQSNLNLNISTILTGK